MDNSFYTTSANGGLTRPAEVAVDPTAIRGDPINPPPAGKVVKMNKITEAQEKELRQFVHKKAESLGATGGKTPLNSGRIDNLEKRLWVIAVKAVIRHDPTKTPLVPFVKAMVNRSAKREAAREFNAMLGADENAWSDRSLDEPITHEDGSEDAFGDLIAEDVETVMRRETKRAVHEVLNKLDWTEQLALGSLMYKDRPAEVCAEQLGVSRPTFLIFRDEIAVPHFIALWEGRE
jgi:hypothetical protein